MDRAEEVLDQLERLEDSYFSLQKQLQEQVAQGLAEVAQSKLTNSAVDSELKACNYRSAAAHQKALVSDQKVELVGVAPKLSDTFGLSPNPNLHRAQSHFTAALRTICQLVEVQRGVNKHS